MFRIPRQDPWPPAIDLATVRETLHYMHDDMRRIPGLEKVADAMAKTIDEIEAAERDRSRRKLNPITARFMPNRLW